LHKHKPEGARSSLPAGPNLPNAILLMYPTPTRVRGFSFTNHSLDKRHYSPARKSS